MTILKTSTVLTLSLFIGMASTQAAILSSDNERRIQVRHGNSNNAYIAPDNRNRPSDDSYRTNLGGDSLQGLINQKQREFEFDAKLSIEENKRVRINRPAVSNRYDTRYGTVDNGYDYEDDYSYQAPGRAMDFNSWLNSSQYRAQQVANFQRYLGSQVGAHNVPPMNQLLTTARSWDKCGYEPYQLPPQELWSNIVPTIKLYNALKGQGILPSTTEIRSVYRSPGLNSCAGGANSSKHMTAGALDIWVPEYEGNSWRTSEMQDNLCRFWQYQGSHYDFGLGIYSTGAVHLDTQGYRKWGAQHTANYSACRY
ncbi:D-Ala-D-Ala carboxypeptidase family metallohydrolase [Psychrobacter jeotgali]|uniref:D-Ala-D-Ala carboxypeptidase family metallohydrolase n=1 Tax=Psychrobacter jeotgali TaxID=179010 RepID=UPI001918F82F|nr:D-Ala-D-Ala carboxypeptidase family metallohydrolase [Psychrobacter jeotgali]